MYYFPGSEIMLFSQTSINNFYILPHWKKSGLHFWIKNWDPENDAVLCITMKPLSKSPVYKLIIGGGSNEDIVLKFVDENSGGRQSLLKFLSLTFLQIQFY